MKSLKAKHYIEETLEIKYSRNNKINLNIEHITERLQNYIEKSNN